jgi:hypothetical protein|tara:strand:- start:6018 stop:6203 length:186 start_codon:yes stop_codon:yes gene_type:complete
MEIIDEILKKYDEEIKTLQITLGNGSAEDYPHYRQMVGSISSIEWCRETIKHIMKKRMEED